jgi:hypothetical protein
LGHSEYLATFDSDKDWTFIVGVQEEIEKLYRHFGRDLEADEMAARLTTIREILE